MHATMPEVTMVTESRRARANHVMKHTIRRTLGWGGFLPLVFAILMFWFAPFVCEAKEPGPEVIPIESGLGLRNPGRLSRSTFAVDPVQALMCRGEFKLPLAGERLSAEATNSNVWEQVLVNTNGWFEHPAMRGGYFAAPVVVATKRSMILEAQGHTMVYVNGEPRAGDVYQYGYLKLPVLLKPGTNLFVFQCGRGRLKAKLVAPAGQLQFDFSDPTLPDLIAGQRPQHWAGLVVINSTPQWQRNLILVSQLDHAKSATTRIPPLPPMSARKIPLQMDGRVIRTNDAGVLQVILKQRERHRDTTLAKGEVKLRIRLPDQAQRKTFVSSIDGSVQYYGFRPAVPLKPGQEPLALFLSLHGAGVEGIGQVETHISKSWGNIVGPTNRRPYGYDWEDWGRMDALEVLDIARNTLHPDPARIYLTGHSMGGHGTWQIGGLYPDKFAAIGPSAGWISFLTYAGRGGPDNAPRTPMESIFRRASGTSDTFALATNYLHQGVYILHGEADDNVPVTQARSMRDVLAGFHKDYDYHEQKGAGHWWDSSDEPGAECMDWPPMYDLFSRRRIPSVDSIRKVQFTTVNPGVSSSCDWLTIEAQTKPLEPSSVEIQADPWARRFIGKTYNVARLRFDLKPIQKDSQFKVELDGQTLDKIPWPPSNQIWLQRVDSQWTHTESARPLTEKGPHRNGPFKDAFRHRMIMVYATQGTPEENAWAFAKARFDAETFYYRGNGSIEIVPDIEFNAGNQPDRSVILYGNADSNSAWESLLGKSPIQVNRGSVSVGGQSRTGESLGCLFLQPRPGSDRACVAVVSGTGLVGMRATDRMPYLAPGVGFPDFTLFSPEVYDQGLKGVLCAGFFGSDWNLTGGEAVWRE